MKSDKKDEKTALFFKEIVPSSHFHCTRCSELLATLGERYTGWPLGFVTVLFCKNCITFYYDSLDDGFGLRELKFAEDSPIIYNKNDDWVGLGIFILCLGFLATMIIVAIKMIIVAINN